MPTIAMSAGGGARLRRAAAPAQLERLQDAASQPPAQVRVQLGQRHDLVVQRGDLADHVHAARPLVLGGRPRRAWARPAPRSGLRSTPLDAIRRRPMLSSSSAWRISCGGHALAAPAGASRRRTRRRTGDGRQRVACPGPLSRKHRLARIERRLLEAR